MRALVTHSSRRGRLDVTLRVQRGRRWLIDRRVLGRLGRAYEVEIIADGRELRLISALFFLGTFVVARLVTHLLESSGGPGGIEIAGLHIHHVVFGLVLLLLSGLLDVNGAAPPTRAALFGAGSALVLDEFALVLNLADVYWAPQGRESIDAVVIFATVLWMAVLGRGFWRAVWKEVRRLGAARAS